VQPILNGNFRVDDLLPGEPTIDGLHREITEETGLPADIDDIVAANSWINTDEQGRFAVHYRCYAPHREIPLSDEHVDAQWITQADVDALLREPQVAAVRAAIDPFCTAIEPIFRSRLIDNVCCRSLHRVIS